MAATNIARPVVHSAQQLEPGVENAKVERGEEVLKEGGLLNPQFGGEYPPSNLAFEILRPDQLPDPRPPRVSFAALRDPKLRMVRAIPLDVTVEDSTVVVSWSEIDEFGTGDTLSVAIDDFARALRELYRSLYAEDVKLGADLRRVRQVLREYIEPRSTK